ncbi:protein DEK-like [Saccostrea echinata]|uniref:protein DEK-like n=1 Tax=Saccostrea echinata TaxID=191078 RepID=UPI002A7F1E8D|nr:protein DEK-like [Saccostrea echinata]
MSDTENDKETSVENMEEDEEPVQDTPKTEESSEEEKSPVKSSPKKTINENKKEEESDEEEEEEEEELQPGLLERPVIIESGKRREKKKVERLSMQEPAPKETKKFEVGDGSGDKLGDCARIEFHISKAKVDDLKALHRLCFNRTGKATLIRKNLRLFNGFAFNKNDDEYKKKLANLKKQTVAVLKKICEILDLERKGVRDEIAERIIDFCLCPKDSGKGIPASKKRKRKSKSGGKAEGKKKAVKKEKKTKAAAKKKKSSSDAEDSESEEESENESKEESESSSSEEEEEEETPPAKKKKTETPKKPAVKKPAPKKEAKKERKVSPKKAESSDEESDEDSDEEPLVKKKEPQPPSDKELKGLIKKILDKANLEEVTMKTVVKQVYARYPTFDLSDRKDFIKETVREMIS